MSDTPWYDRNWVLWLAGTIVVIGLALLQPFIDKSWPATVGGWLRLFRLPFGLVIAIGVAGYALGYSLGPFIVSVVGLSGFVVGHELGRRRRPYSGPLFAIDTMPSVQPVPPAEPNVSIVPLQTDITREAYTLGLYFEWVVTPVDRDYTPVRADLRIDDKTYRTHGALGVRVPQGATLPGDGIIPATKSGKVWARFNVPLALTAKEHVTGDVTITDSLNGAVSRTVDFGRLKGLA